jgi:uncharacterized membrane protein
MSEAGHERGYLPLQRSEALTDGIFAVAMTLLVIELKLPEHAAIHSADDLHAALFQLLPKGIAWVMSFFVLALFWIGHHRLFASLRRADAMLVRLNLLQLAAVSLMPFCSALSGEFGGLLVSQGLFSLDMAVLGVTALLILRHVYRHPELCHAPVTRAQFRGARLRIGGLILVSAVAFAIAAWLRIPAMGNMAFMLMAVISPWSRRIERNADASEAPAAPT